MEVPRVLLEVSQGTLLTETSGEVVIRARDTEFFTTEDALRPWLIGSGCLWEGGGTGFTGELTLPVLVLRHRTKLTLSRGGVIEGTHTAEHTETSHELLSSRTD